MTTQIVLASTAFGLATVTAAYDNGLLARCERRILVITCNTAMPEATTPMRDIAGAPELIRQFDAVYDYNACIEPQHPSIWRPRPGDLPLWERQFRLLWNLGADDLNLVVESIQVNPAQALCRIFGDARIDVYADGLMSYGPTRTALPRWSPAESCDCCISILCPALRRYCSASGTCPPRLSPVNASGLWSRSWSPTALHSPATTVSP